MRMNRIAFFLAVCSFGSSLAAQEKPARPRITGIAHVRIYVSDVGNSWQFYASVLYFPTRGGGCTVVRPCLPVNGHQQIEFARTPKVLPDNWLAEVAFATDDVAQMHRYLLANGIALGTISKEPNGSQHFELADPELNRIAFVQLPKPSGVASKTFSEQVGNHLLHAGFVVRDAPTEDHFYRDLLGFRMYWHGGFKDTDTDWEELQVPDGSDWIEYMLNISANADHKELGVQNHFSLGVKDAQVAAAQLRKNGLQTFDGPEIGRDGKNSLDAYDPDGTRVEIMEFTPTQKPCCHPYTADHPKP
jgi:catechol 2,3-dioxygenase-like lactoylglutathione lyase family enzyme